MAEVIFVGRGIALTCNNLLRFFNWFFIPANLVNNNIKTGNPTILLLINNQISSIKTNTLHNTSWREP